MENQIKILKQLSVEYEINNDINDINENEQYKKLIKIINSTEKYLSNSDNEEITINYLTKNITIIFKELTKLNCPFINIKEIPIAPKRAMLAASLQPKELINLTILFCWNIENIENKKIKSINYSNKE